VLAEHLHIGIRTAQRLLAAARGGNHPARRRAAGHHEGNPARRRVVPARQRNAAARLGTFPFAPQAGHYPATALSVRSRREGVEMPAARQFC
jgi:hypothetical protein